MVIEFQITSQIMFGVLAAAFALTFVIMMGGMWIVSISDGLYGDDDR